jgi:hypothetical protein
VAHFDDTAVLALLAFLLIYVLILCGEIEVARPLSHRIVDGLRDLGLWFQEKWEIISPAKCCKNPHLVDIKDGAVCLNCGLRDDDKLDHRRVAHYRFINRLKRLTHS